MNMENSGSPILARQNPTLYWILVFTIAAVALVFLVSFIVKRVNAWRSSPKFAESHKKVYTTKKNITTISRKASLTSNETKLLWYICKKNKTPNIVYLNKDRNAINELFREQYRQLKNSSASEEQIGTLFSILYKMEKLRSQDYVITSSEKLKAGQELYFKDSDGYNWCFTIQKNTSQGIFLEIPRMLANDEKRPKPLSKFVLTVTSNANTAYIMQTRAIRYEEALDGTKILVIKPSNTLQPIQRRKYKRKEVDQPCIFTEVEPRSGTSENSKNYAVMGANINGRLNNISSSGCSLMGHADIMAGHYILVKFQLNGEETEAVGIILSSTKDIDGEKTNYHIKFTDVQLSTRNSIYAFIYGFTDDLQSTSEEDA